VFNSKVAEDVLLRGSVASGSFEPGQSDIDLIFIIKELGAKEELKYLKSFWRRFEILYKICPLFAEISIFNLKEFNSYIKAPKFCYYFAFKKGRFLLKSKNIRKVIELPFFGLQRIIIQEGFYYFRRLLPFIFEGRDVESLRATKKRSMHKFLMLTQPRLFYPHFIEDIESGSLEYNLIKRHDLEILKEIDYRIDDDAFMFKILIKRLEGILKATTEYFQKGRSLASLDYGKRNNYKTEMNLVIQERLMPTLTPLVHKIKSHVKTIILSPAIWENYNYKLIIVFNETALENNLHEILPYVKKFRMNIKNSSLGEYFDTNFLPLVCHEEICNSFLLFDNPLDFCALKRDSIVVYGSDFYSREFEIDDFLLQQSKEYILRAPLLIRRRFKSLEACRNKSFYVRSLIDFVAGILPASRLLMEKKILVFSAREAMETYNRVCDSPYKEFLKEFNDRYVKFSMFDFFKLNPDALLDKSFSYIKYELDKIFMSSKEQFERISV